MVELYPAGVEVGTERCSFDAKFSGKKINDHSAYWIYAIE